MENMQAFDRLLNKSSAHSISWDVHRIAAVLFSVLAVSAIVGIIGCSSVPATTDSQSSYQNSQNVVLKKWYEGGTLHKKSALEWQVAQNDDKLATCADFVATMWQNKNLVPSIQSSIGTVDDMKPYAQELVIYLDAATEEHPDPEENKRMYVNQEIASLAVIGMVSMGWVKQ